MWTTSEKKQKITSFYHNIESVKLWLILKGIFIYLMHALFTNAVHFVYKLQQDEYRQNNTFKAEIVIRGRKSHNKCLSSKAIIIVYKMYGSEPYSDIVGILQN